MVNTRASKVATRLPTVHGPGDGDFCRGRIAVVGSAIVIPLWSGFRDGGDEIDLCPEFAGRVRPGVRGG